MKTIIAGSRSITDINVVMQAILAVNFPITEVVSGTCRGVDRLGEAYAVSQGIKISRFPADWKKYPKAAGAIRNKEMAEYADALIAVWDGKSKGTLDMIKQAGKHGLKIYVHGVNVKNTD